MSELYYAEMEAARNEAESAYFAARPQIGTIADRTLFRAGFERGFGSGSTNEPLRRALTQSGDSK